jgi:oligopeptidase B
LRDDTRTSPEVLGYLKAENAYKDAMLAPLAGAEQQLFDELVARIPQEDASVPVRENGYEYSTRWVRGGEYPIHVRKRAQPGAAEEVLLDGNVMARGHDYFRIGGFEVSDDGRMLAWAEDTVGRRQHVIRFKDLATGELHADQLGNAESALAWAADNQTLLYIEKDPETLLGRRVRRHRLGSNAQEDPVVYEQPDPAFYISVWRSRSQRYLNIGSRATDTSEQRVARADDPQLSFQLLIARERGHEYAAEDLGDRFVLRTNRDAPNFRIVEAPQARVADRTAWRELVAHPIAGFIEDFEVFEGFLAYVGRERGLSRVFVRRWSDGKIEPMTMPEASYTAELGANSEVDSPTVRFEFTSLKTPRSVYEYDVPTRQASLRKRDWVGEGYDPERYESGFLSAPARDGTPIPVSIV